jgi:hypothetical protein
MDLRDGAAPGCARTLMTERMMNEAPNGEQLHNVPKLHGRPTVLLFYDGFELGLRPGLMGWAHSQVRGLARYIYRGATHQQVWTGFYTAFRSLVVSLRRYGCDVRVNALGLAARNPHFPIGIAGYPSVLAAADVPNPRLFGPGDYGYPDVAAVVAKDPRNRILTQPSDWPVAFYRESCGDKLRVMFVGIDTELWPDLSHMRKDLDFLVYDKIRWHGGAVRHDETPAILARTTEALDRRNLNHAVLRYGAHHRSQFRDALSRARGMIFLCEHETQGLAYQEALASNVPVLALDEGVLADPDQRRFARPDLRVSSVPYFDARCGETFIPDQLDDALDRFLASRTNYRPRDYVLSHLSMRKAAENYLELYTSLA